MEEYKNNEVKFDSRVLSSSHLNFFFGAGVNGRAIKQMKDLKKTVKLLEEKQEREMISFENDLLDLPDESKDIVLECFLNEIKEDITNFSINHEDIKDQSQMFASINKLLMQSENRTRTMKQVNIYTTNYDHVVETVLNSNGLLCNVISSSNIESNDKFFDLIGYDYSKEVFIPTYLVSKIHGDLDNPILPSKNKFDETLMRKRFEILFKMKSQLSRRNSLLFVIGYSGNDEHLNQLINDSIGFGLTVYWFKYDNNEKVPKLLSNKVIIVQQQDNDNKKNPTAKLSEMVNELWASQLEE
ncbi:MAG: SIR2 family protein [Firmicutes bacterium]|nr:SIR2 family protein [Bacillota bacterium]